MVNEITICGTVLDGPELLCARDSGNVDRLLLYNEETLTNYIGNTVCISGSIRSKRKEKLCIDVKDICISPQMSSNYVLLEGRICKISSIRRSSLNRKVCTIIVAVGDGNYIPCVLWNGDARRSSKMRIGNKIKIEGRLQSRNFYTKVLDVLVDKTTYEVSVMKILN